MYSLRINIKDSLPGEATSGCNEIPSTNAVRRLCSNPSRKAVKLANDTGLAVSDWTVISILYTPGIPLAALS